MLARVNVASFTGSIPSCVSGEYSRFISRFFLPACAPCACVLRNFPRFLFWRRKVPTIFRIATELLSQIRCGSRPVMDVQVVLRNMSSRKLDAARVREIYRRQEVPTWGPRYLPAQLAQRSEAPGISRYAQLYSSQLQRNLHALSTPEMDAFALAMYHPFLFEFKEGLIMQVQASDHPLVGHPKARGLQLPTTSGTAPIAERLGVFAQHPKVLEESIDDKGMVQGHWLPCPWILDPMLFLEDSIGPYCVSWDIKRSHEDHGKPGPGDFTQRTSPKAIKKANARELVYREYMRELNIRIVRVAQTDIPRNLAANLRHLFIQHGQFPIIGETLHAEILEALDEAFLSGNPPIEVMAHFSKSGVKPRTVLHCLEHAIFERRIRVDLYQPCLPDRPMIPERTDVLIEFAHWFMR